MSVRLPVLPGWGSLVGLLYTLSCGQEGLMGNSGSQIETGTPFLKLWWDRHREICKLPPVALQQIFQENMHLNTLCTRKSFCFRFQFPLAFSWWSEPGVVSLGLLFPFLFQTGLRTLRRTEVTYSQQIETKAPKFRSVKYLCLKVLHLNHSRLHCFFWYLVKLENVQELTKSDSSPSSSPSGDSSDSCSSSRGLWMKNKWIKHPLREL